METYIIILIIIAAIIILWKLFSGKERRRNFTESEKKQILAREKYTCAMCGDKDWKLFEFHHKIPFSQGGDTSVDNGQCYCPKCHAIVTRSRGNMR
jgi:5-methylcytosine-specific restriction endonuclease McrA